MDEKQKSSFSFFCSEAREKITMMMMVIKRKIMIDATQRNATQHNV
jgi:hypothetical protein